MSRFALLRTPEEAADARRWWRAAQELLRDGRALPEDGLRHLARNREARLTHINGNLARPADPRGHPDPHAFTAEQKLKDARSLDEALAWLTPIERVEVAGDARLLNQLALLPDARALLISDLEDPTMVRRRAILKSAVALAAAASSGLASARLPRRRLPPHRPAVAPGAAAEPALRLCLAQGTGAQARRQRLPGLAGYAAAGDGEA